MPHSRRQKALHTCPAVIGNYKPYLASGPKSAIVGLSTRRGIDGEQGAGGALPRGEGTRRLDGHISRRGIGDALVRVRLLERPSLLREVRQPTDARSSERQADAVLVLRLSKLLQRPHRNVHRALQRAAPQVGHRDPSLPDESQIRLQHENPSRYRPWNGWKDARGWRQEPRDGTVGVKSFWSVLKRAHKETFHKISPKHLDSYVKESAGKRNLRD